MRMFGEESLSPGTKSAFRGIARVLEQGGTLDDAIRGPGRRLPRFLRGVFIAAGRSGSIERVIGDYLGGSRRTRRARRSVIAAILYPAFLATMICLLSIAMFGVILPPFKFMFQDFGLELPWPTKALMLTSDLVVASWMWLLAGLGLVITVLCVTIFSMRLPIAATTLRLLQSVPIIGTASALAGASEFCLLLAMLVRARIPFPETLRLTAAGLRDANLRQGTLRLARDVERGETPAYAASILPHFGPRLVPLFRHTTNEETFAEILKSHGELFALQAEAHAGIAVMWMQPLLLLLVGVMGAFVVVGLFLPLMHLLNALA
jgi:type II secretory pathway component PulF